MRKWITHKMEMCLGFDDGYNSDNINHAIHMAVS